MSREIVIDPVTRIEGHAKITIQLDDTGEVADAHFHVTQFRGFERIVQGRPVHEMPSIMARICGICPVSHLIASVQGVRRDPRRRAAADRRRPAAGDEPRPDRPVERAELLPPLRRRTCCSASTPTRPGATSSAGRRPTRSWPGTGSRCAASASRSSNGSAASGSIPPGSCRAASTRRCPPRDRATRSSPRSPRRWRPSSGRSPGTTAPLERWADEAARVRRLPLGLHGPGRTGRQRRPLRRAAARRRRGRPPARRRHRPAALRDLPRRGRRAVVVPQVDVLEASSATRTACTGSARWPGSTSPTRWAPRAPTRRWTQFRARLGPIPTSSFHYHHARLIDTLHACEKLEAAAARPRHPLPPGPGRRRDQRPRRRRGLRGAARHALPPLPGGRRRARRVGEPGDRHRATTTSP